MVTQRIPKRIWNYTRKSNRIFSRVLWKYIIPQNSRFFQEIWSPEKKLKTLIFEIFSSFPTGIPITRLSWNPIFVYEGLSKYLTVAHILKGMPFPGATVYLEIYPHGWLFSFVVFFFNRKKSYQTTFWRKDYILDYRSLFRVQLESSPNSALKSPSITHKSLNLCD